MDGEVFYTIYGSKIYFDKNASCSPFRFEDASLDSAFPVQWHKEQNWYENIPEKGVPCWVWNDEGGNTKLGLVHLCSGDGWYACDDGKWWRNARPVTKEELFDE